MDREVIKKLSRMEREIGKLKVQERLVPENMATAAFLSIPGLIGFWPTSSHNTVGSLLDLSGNGLDLLNVGTSSIAKSSADRLAPFVFFNGSTQYLRIADTNLWMVLVQHFIRC